MRERLPDTRAATVHKFRVGSQKGYINLGFYPDGRIAELFVHLDKSRDNGWTQCVGVLFSLCLQHGVPLEVVCKKLMHQRFEPSGVTENKNIPMADSIPDYIVKFIQCEYGEKATLFQR